MKPRSPTEYINKHPLCLTRTPLIQLTQQLSNKLARTRPTMQCIPLVYNIYTRNVKSVGMACQNVHKQGRDDVHEIKGQRIGKAPSLHLFHTAVSVWKLLGILSYLIATYKAYIHIRLMQCICCQINMFLGYVPGGKWPGNEANTMPCTFMTLSWLCIDSALMPLV